MATKNTKNTNYTNGRVSDVKQYAIAKFKEACRKKGITWKKEWEKLLDD